MEPVALDVAVDDLPGLRSPGRLLRLLAAHPTGVDAAVVLPCAALALIAAVLHPEGQALSLVFAAVLLVPLIWRRSRPLAVFALLAAIAFVQWLLDVTSPGDAALVIALYSVAASRPRRWTLLAAGVTELGVVLAAVRWGGPPVREMFSAFVFLTGMMIAACATGVNIGGRRARLAYLEDRAARLERERDQQNRLGAAAERARIAREMHDVVAHNLSVMIALADGVAFTLDTDPAEAGRAVQAVSDTGREALGEMRRLLGILRDDAQQDTRAPQPGLGDLDRLVEQVRATGLPVTLEVGGEPLALSAGAALTVYRLVQEALTNTLKHGGPAATAQVRLRYGAGALEVEILDGGPLAGAGGQGGAGGPAGAGGQGSAGGQGLVGMRERVAAFGGIVVAGPRPTGGWRVHARLPAAPDPVAPADGPAPGTASPGGPVPGGPVPGGPVPRWVAAQRVAG